MNLFNFISKIDHQLDETIHIDASKLERLIQNILKDFGGALHSDIGDKLTKYDDEYCFKLKPKHVKVVRSPQVRCVQCIAGMISFKRREYLDMNTGKKFYFVDDALGLQKRHRLSDLLKLNILSLRQKKSCREVSNLIFGRVSRQTVTNIVFNCVPDCLNIDFSLCQSRDVTDVFLEADEDHTKLQNGYSKAVNLVYVHEGYVLSSKGRNKLKNPFFIPQMAHRNIWSFAAKYIHARYGKNVRIHVCGDGANWIKSAQKYFPDCIYKLDKFHTYKAVTSIAGKDYSLRSKLIAALRNKDHIELTKCYDLAIKNDTSCGKSLAFDYLENNFKYIDLSAKNHCSAEAHISHIYSTMFSSRPHGWSKKGLLKMAMLRTILYSNIDIYTLFEPLQKFKNVSSLG